MKQTNKTKLNTINNILIVGTNFSSKFNAIKTQGEYLHELLIENGVHSQIVSDQRGFLERILQTCLAVLRLKSGQKVIIQVYGTKSLYLEWLSGLICLLKRHKIILTLHGGDIPNMFSDSRIKRVFFNSLFKWADTVTAPSNYLFFGLNNVGAKLVESKLKVVRNFIDLNDYSGIKKCNKKINIFWMRSFHEVYNPILALNCLKELLNSGYDFRMYMAGPDQGFLKRLKHEIKKLKLENNVILLGKIDNKKKCEIASQCFLYLNTTVIDNSPVSFLEMMALGLPIVSTDVGGIKYWVENNRNALLAEKNTVADLKNKIEILYHDNSVYEKIRKNNLEKIKEFSKDNVLKDWLVILN